MSMAMLPKPRASARWAKQAPCLGPGGTLRPMLDLVLLRHGQSVWNAENLFTGWEDVGLSEKGEAEAVAAGRLMAAEAGLDLRILHTSVLVRAITTAQL